MKVWFCSDDSTSDNTLGRRPARSVFRLAPVAALFCAGIATAGSAAAREVIFGIVPQQSATRLAQVWVPFLDRLSKQTGHQIRFATAKDIPTFEACLSRGAYDVAYMNPYHYTVFHKQAGYEAFARQSDKRLKGIIVARNDSPIASLNDLNGAEVAFPSPAAFGASVIPRAEMRASGIEITPQYVKSHDSVYRSVALGLYPAGGGVGRTFGNVPEDLRAQLKVIYKTDGYTPHAFAAAPDLPADIKAALTISMIEFKDEALLRQLGMTGFEGARDSDWNDVRDLNLTVSQTEIVASGELVCRSD